MSVSARQLTELVRLLEARGHVFAADRAAVQARLQVQTLAPEAKLHRRAELLDADGRLREALQRTQQWLDRLGKAAVLLWLLLGLVSAFGLMAQSGQNFFLLLAGVLGVHSLTLLVWLLSLWLPLKNGGWLSNPTYWLRGRDPIQQAVLRLYTEEWQQPAVRWRLGANLHRLWLAALSGMLLALLLLLSVRQYTFNWESTLLGEATLLQLVAALSWLPAKLGFAVPDAVAISASRMPADTAAAHQWGWLLVGSLLCYGILPRLAAWLFCHFRWRQQQAAALPLELPYYRAILQSWQRQVVDADRGGERPAVASAVRLSDAAKWALMLEAPWPQQNWHQGVLDADWQDRGCADSRDALAHELAAVRQIPVQLLVGVRAKSVPDRGILRQLLQLAEAAEGGVVVQLLAEEGDGAEHTLSLWQQALNERRLPWLNPPVGRNEAV